MDYTTIPNFTGFKAMSILLQKQIKIITKLIINILHLKPIKKNNPFFLKNMFKNAVKRPKSKKLLQISYK
jgi:hypothetical protein